MKYFFIAIRFANSLTLKCVIHEISLASSLQINIFLRISHAFRYEYALRITNTPLKSATGKEDNIHGYIHNDR